MNDIDRAWVAGFIDGEGCLTILKSSKREGKNHVYYRPMITICNTSLELLEHVRNLTGFGHIYQRVHFLPNAKLQHILYIYRKQEILQFCREIKTYLIGKRKQAEILIEACQHRENCPDIHQKIRMLNKRGER